MKEAVITRKADESITQITIRLDNDAVVRIREHEAGDLVIVNFYGGILVEDNSKDLYVLRCECD